MEYALTADHHRVHAFDAEKGQEYYCPVCGNQVIPRQGEVNSWHFAHVTSCVDDWKYDMSEWHRNWQNRFPESTREVVIEYKGESHRADILTGGYVIEFQHSPITSTEFERRNLFYTKAGYKVIWVFDERVSTSCPCRVVPALRNKICPKLFIAREEQDYRINYV